MIVCFEYDDVFDICEVKVVKCRLRRCIENR